MIKEIINKIDGFLNSITMYRLLFWGLTAMAVVAIIMGFLNIIHYSGLAMIVSLIVLWSVCQGSNTIFAKIFKIPANVESSYITALILFFIMMPASNGQTLLGTALAGLIAMASKYLLARNKRHFFNPAAFGAFLVGALSLGGAIWWVGSIAMLVPNAILAILILRKTRRFTMFGWFFGASLLTITIVYYGLYDHGGTLGFLTNIWRSLISWPIIFLGSIMLTEPLTAPPTKKLRSIYGAINGVLMNLPFATTFISTSPELSILISNIFSYCVSLKERFILSLVERKMIAKDIYELSFKNTEKKPINLGDKPGQYVEWTLEHPNPDTRGFRRYFSIASGYSDEYLKIGVKIGENCSTFKKKLLSMNAGEKIVVGGLYGDFLLPENKEKKVAFIAGGIGVTPFVSMVKTIIFNGEKRDIAMFYSVKSEDEIAYREIFVEAEEKLGMKNHYVVGTFITEEMVRDRVADYKERTFYLSGPNAMVQNYKNMLKKMGVKEIMTDYFPGY